MKQDANVQRLRAQIWERVMTLPVTLNGRVFDDLGTSYNGAVTSLIDHLSADYMERSETLPTMRDFPASDILAIVSHVKGYIDSTQGSVHSYNEAVSSYLAAIR